MAGDRIRGWVRSPLVMFPVLALVVMATLVLFNLNGSSVALLGVNYHHDSHLLHGEPRGIRSDEAALSTPALVGNTRRGLPTTPWIGLTATFLPATSIGVPSNHWSELFKPQDWGVFVLGVSRGFAWHWWSQVIAAVLGTFALLFTVTRRRWTSAALATVAALSPYVAWWSLTPGLALGFSTGAAAAMISALRSRSTRGAVAFAGLAGVLGTATFLLLYPPWQVTLAWVLLGLVVGSAVDARVPLRRFALVCATTAATLAVPVAGWLVQSHSALVATTNTIYPGQRLASAGQGNVAWLFDQMSSPFAALAPAISLRGPSVMADGRVILANQSEIASGWLPLPIVIMTLVSIVVLAQRRLRTPAPSGEPGGGTATRETVASIGAAAGAGLDTRPADIDTTAAAEGAGTATSGGQEQEPGRRFLWAAVGVAAAGVVLLAWSLVPLPDWLGKVTLLNRVPGQRTSLALGLVTILLLAMGSASLRGVRWPRPWVLAWGAATATTVWLMVWAADVLPWGRSGQPHLGSLLLVAVAFAVAFTLVATGTALRTGLAVLVVGSFATWALVNPLYQGLGPLTNDPLVRAMEPLAAGPNPARVAVFGSLTLDALVQGSGVVTLSGLTVYPDAAVWLTLAPTQEEEWNNYGKYTWVADASANPAVIVSSGSTSRVLRIDPCAPQTLALHLDWVVADTDLASFSCLRPVDTIKRGKTLLYRYRVITP